MDIRRRRCGSATDRLSLTHDGSATRGGRPEHGAAPQSIRLDSSRLALRGSEGPDIGTVGHQKRQHDFSLADLETSDLPHLTTHRT